MFETVIASLEVGINAYKGLGRLLRKLIIHIYPNFQARNDNYLMTLPVQVS